MISLAPTLYNFVRPKRLLDLVTVIIMALVVFLLVAIGGIFSQMAFDIVDKQTRKRAVQTARQLALLPDVQHFVATPENRWTITALIDGIRNQTDVEYVVITDLRGLILSHSDPSRIGGTLNDAMIDRALKFGSDYSQRTLENGKHFIRGAVPVTDHRHAIIGMVAAGYPLETMRRASDLYLERIVFFTFVFITLGLIAAIFIARGVKWVIFGLEPAEIAYMFQERTALIESIREGIISTDISGKITLVNGAALKTLNLPSRGELEGRRLDEVFPGLDAEHLLATGEAVGDREFILTGIPIIVNVEPVGERHGLVVTFRKKEDIDIIARELSQVKTFSDMLRAQTHEYANSLHTIVGLIQIGAHAEVLEYIAEQTHGHRKLIRFLAENLPDRILSSMIIGKYMFAGEQKVDFDIDPESRMIDIPDGLDRHTLTTTLGNIIDNAIEAAQANREPGKRPWVRLSMSDFGHDLIFEIEDSGQGIDEEMVERIFEKGVTTKNKPSEQHGYGLYLAKKAIDTLGGTIQVGPGDEGGARFEIIIDKTRFRT